MGIIFTILFAGFVHAESSAVSSIRAQFAACSKGSQNTDDVYQCTKNAHQKMNSLLNVRQEQIRSKMSAAKAKEFDFNEDELDVPSEGQCSTARDEAGRADAGRVRYERCMYHFLLDRVTKLERSAR